VPNLQSVGELQAPSERGFVRYSIDLPKIAKTLKGAGYSYREIADIMGYKGPGSVLHLIKQKQ